ncbi:low molecular weight phosphatase family protein [Streptomyces sp. NPDC056105]|uniref:arsenate-mycothiol transferase ArsC n=1 Tax=Streptomyces sp. NPDC056105 TaxID=3345714 RepID=UPI0035DC97F6
MSPSPVLPDERLAAGATRLAASHRGRFCAETVQRVITDSYERLAVTARVTTHLVVLAERLAAERLDALAHAERLDALAHIEGAPGSGLPRVLFVCSHNAGRSQLAAALLAHRAQGHVTVSSAGTHPAASVEPVVAQVLTEAGVPSADAASPKPLTDEVVQAADIVITMGCDDVCPVVAGRRYLDWPVADPEGAPIAVVRTIRDAIDAHITELLDSLPSTA